MTRIITNGRAVYWSRDTDGNHVTYTPFHFSFTVPLNQIIDISFKYGPYIFTEWVSLQWNFQPSYIWILKRSLNLKLMDFFPHIYRRLQNIQIGCLHAMYVSCTIHSSSLCKPIKDYIRGRRLNLTRGFSYYMSFRSSLQSHHLWVTL